MKLSLYGLLTSLLLMIPFHGNRFDEEFEQPTSSVVEEPGINEQVTNGHMFESARLKLTDNQELLLPEGCVVEEYDGESVQFFLTKEIRCMGHPPAPLRIRDTRRYFGIAVRENNHVLSISTFGEWQNRDGFAKIKMLVLIPRGTSYQKSSDLCGTKSPATRELDFEDEALKSCYWYTGIGPVQGWDAIETELHRNRFLPAN